MGTELISKPNSNRRVVLRTIGDGVRQLWKPKAYPEGPPPTIVMNVREMRPRMSKIFSEAKYDLLVHQSVLEADTKLRGHDELALAVESDTEAVEGRNDEKKECDPYGDIDRIRPVLCRALAVSVVGSWAGKSLCSRPHE